MSDGLFCQTRVLRERRGSLSTGGRPPFIKGHRRSQTGPLLINSVYRACDCGGGGCSCVPVVVTGVVVHVVVALVVGPCGGGIGGEMKTNQGKWGKGVGGNGGYLKGNCGN